MPGAIISLSNAARALVAALVLIAGSVAVASALGSGLAFLGLTLWLLTLGIGGAGVLLIARAGRPVAGAGAIVSVVAMWLAFQYQLPVALWTLVLLAGVGLIAWGTAADSPVQHAWVLMIPRVAFGWAWIDNAQDHFRLNWLPGGGAFAQQATVAANRQPLNFLDPVYQGFLKGTVAPNADVWASLTLCGELAFGMLLAVGLLTPVAAAGLLVQSFNYVEMKGFVPHNTYADKAFFAADLYLLVTQAGLALGLDASLRSVVPSFLRPLVGVTADEATGTPSAPRQQPGLA